jgi:hypothetical protein
MMNQLTSIQRLADHIRRIETEIVAIRQELKTLPEQQSQQSMVDVVIPQPFVNKAILKEQMRHLFLTLSIQGEPVGAEMLQKQMGKAGLTSNEMSQSIMAAREE